MSTVPQQGDGARHANQQTSPKVSLRQELASILADASIQPPLDDRWCCLSCGNWTPHNHPEAHAHEDDCTALAEVRRRRDWRARLGAVLKTLQEDPAPMQVLASEPVATCFWDGKSSDKLYDDIDSLIYGERYSQDDEITVYRAHRLPDIKVRVVVDPRDSECLSHEVDGTVPPATARRVERDREPVYAVYAEGKRIAIASLEENARYAAHDVEGARVVPSHLVPIVQT